jgi:glycosyltransferase involved in cell wall biosynthesis
MVPVLLASSSAKAAGSERVHVSLTRQLPGFGFEPIPVLFEHGPLGDWLLAEGFRPRVIEMGRGRARRGLRTVHLLRRMIEEIGARAVFSNQSNTHVYAGLAAMSLNVPAVWWQHGSAPRSLRERVAAAVPASAVVCSSEATRNAQQRLSPNRRVEVVYPGIPVAEIRRWRGRGEAVRETLGWDAHPIVGILGRLSPWKGQSTFLEAASLLASKRPDVRFVVAGGALMGREGAYPECLRQLAESLGIGDRVHFAGHVDEPYAWLDALDVVVHASRGEPFGLVIVEAMALGKPVVCARDGGPVEIVADQECALTVPPLDHRSLTAAVMRVLEEPGLAEALSKRAASRAEAFSEEKVAEELAGILEEAIHRGAW